MSTHKSPILVRSFSSCFPRFSIALLEFSNC